jgi:hypothetical protein
MGLAGNLGDSGRFDEALALGEAVIAGLREIGHHAWAVNASNDRAAIFARLGRFDLARQLVADPVPEAPRWLQAARCLVRSRLLRMQGLDGREEMARAEALFGQDGLSDMYPRLKVGVEAARVSSPVLAEERAAEAVAWAQQHEHVAFARYASMVRVESLQRQGRLDEAAAEAAALAADPGALTQAIGYYLPELVQVLADALAAAGQAAAAQALVAQGAGWITRCAREHVSPPYRESFVHRNPINARLLARAGQAAAAVTGG